MRRNGVLDAQVSVLSGKDGPQPTFVRTVIAAKQFPEPAFRDIAQKNRIREGQQ